MFNCKILYKKKKQRTEQIYTEYAKSTTNVEKMVQSIIKGTLCL